MDPQALLLQRAQVQEFQRRHQSKLVTMVFSDVVGSTKLKQTLGDHAAIEVILQHHAFIHEILSCFDEGEEISTAGDAFFIVFAKPSDAVRFSLLIQAGLRQAALETGHRVFDRIGIHVGEVWVDETAAPGKGKDLYGIQVDTCARIASLGGADQILLTRFAFDSARQVLKGDDLENLGPLSWLNHGPYLMKGLDEPLEVCEVGEGGKALLTRPTDTEKAHRFISADGEPVLGWRPALDQPVPGTDWVLEKKLGEGGFGEVWLGRDKALKTRHVFKFCFRADRVRSLKREVTLFRLLKERVGAHSNIVRIEATYFEEPPYYIVMEYVDASDLAAWSEARGGCQNVPLDVRLEIVAQAADALQAAHDSGVIHRDVKPANILIGATSGAGVRVYLTDFGIGQVVSEEALAGVTRLGFTGTIMNSPLTQSGTHLYMAPELFAGKAASIRSDIYALGVVLYQLLTGDLTLPVTTDWAKHIHDPLLQGDLEKCFAGDPQERFAGAGQLAEQLRSLEEQRMALAIQQRDARERERAAYRRGVVRTSAVALAIVAAVALLTVYALQQARRARRSERLAIASEQAAHASKRDAELQLAESLVAQGDALGLAGSWPEAKRRYIHAREVFVQTGGLTAQADLGTWEAEIKSPSPLNSWADGSAGIIAGTLSDDGRLALSSDVNSTLQLWDAVLGVPLRAFRSADFASLLPAGAGLPDRALAFSHSGRYALAGSRDASIKLWDLTNGKLLRVLSGHAASVQSVAFSPDDGFALSGSKDGTVRLWDVSTGQELRSMKHEALVRKVDYLADGRRGVSASWDKTIRIWDLDTGSELLNLKSNGGGVNGMAVSRDGKMALSADNDYLVRLWDLGAKEEVKAFRGHTEQVRDVMFSTNQYAVSTADDATVRVWELSTGAVVRTFAGGHAGEQTLTLAADNHTALFASNDRGMLLLDTRAGREALSISSGAIGRLAISSRGELLACGEISGNIIVRDACSGRELKRFKLPSSVANLTFSNDDSSLWAASADRIFTFGLSSGESKQIGQIKPSVPLIAISPTCRRFATAKKDGFILTIYDADTGAEERTVPLKDSFPETSAEVDFDEKVTIAAGEPPYDVHAMAFSPYNDLLLISASRRTQATTNKLQPSLTLWDTASGRKIRTFTGHTNPVKSLAFSNDGKFAVSTGVDRSIKIWNVESGQMVQTIDAHAGPSQAVIFTPDTSQIASVEDNETIRIWDVASGRQLRAVAAGAKFRSGVFTPDGEKLILAGLGNHINILDLSRTRRYRQFQPLLARARETLRVRSDDPEGLLVYGQWYAFRGMWRWAAELLEKARAGGANVSPLELGRCYWELSDRAAARRELLEAKNQGEVSAIYLSLCLAALESKGP